MDKTYKDYLLRMIRTIEIEVLREGLKQRGFYLVPKGLDLVSANIIKPKQDDRG
jgi:hypothetical protein